MRVQVDYPGYFSRSTDPVQRKAMISRQGIAGVLALAMTCAGSAAYAQDAAAEGADQGGISEIVVTAEHRESTVQKTPIAISVYSGDDLLSSGSNNIQNLSRVAPDIAFSQSDGSPIIAIRGISSRDTTEVGDPAVAVSTDSYYTNRSLTLVTSLYDIERIEVLRGPQGTLYGRNATGGAINILTRRPGDDFAGYVAADYGNFNAVNVEGAVNIPLTESLQTRVSFQTRSHDPYRKTPPFGGGGDENSKSVRMQVAFKPTSRLSAGFLFQYTKADGAGQVSHNVPFVFLPGGALSHAKPDPIASREWAAGTPNFTRIDDKAFRWNLAYDLGGATITYLGGYEKFSRDHADDNSNGGRNYNFSSFITSKTWNHELRIAGQADRFKWQVGTFYFKEDLPLLAGEFFPNPNGTYARNFSFLYNYKADSIAGFGQASYDLTDKLTLTAGARYTHDKKARIGSIQVPIAQDPVTFEMSYLVIPQDAKGSWSKFTWQATLDYKVTPDNLLYAKVSTGYKAGGFTDLNSYDPETVTSYEIGSKNRFFDDRLQLNVAAHYENYKGQQVSQIVGNVNNGGGTIIRNAGSSHIYGLETQLVGEITRSTRLSASVNYLHARFHDFVTAPDGTGAIFPLAPDGVNVQLAGLRLPTSPDWTAVFALDQDFEVGGGKLTAHLDTKLQSRVYYSYFNYDSTRQSGYMMSNAQLTYAPSSGNWEVQAFINNIENKTVIANATENVFSNSYRYAFFPPRTYGARLTYRW